MRRREFITLLGGAAAWPLAARAQRTERMRRIGVLMPYPVSDIEGLARVAAFRQELRRLGLADDSVNVDEYWAGSDDADRIRVRAMELVESAETVATGDQCHPDCIYWGLRSGRSGLCGKPGTARWQYDRFRSH